MTRKTFYYCHDLPEKQVMLQEHMRELSEHISHPPIEISYRFTELPKELEEGLREIFSQSDDVCCWSSDLSEFFLERQEVLCTLLVICAKESRLAKVSLEANSDAEWGIAVNNLAIVYGLHHKNSVWHEMLHLLGADDCYDLSESDRGPNCDCPNCIMQYDATIADVKSWPFLCDTNIQNIQKRIRGWQGEG
ncbi:MAG: hypothetical protein ISS70_13980 [Phycisphaerae bacterium]|nr:hypothetical protein [Phycisphaerae bacterium]